MRTRFAPSPTGSLHVGNARIAVLNWLLTRHGGGTSILRIEDTDVERNVEGSETDIFRDLRWLGLDWDEGPEFEGRPPPAGNGPYRQSERGHLYSEAAGRLAGRGLVYECYCTDEDLDAMRTASEARGEPIRYDRRCARLSDAEREAKRAAGSAGALRFAVPDDEEVIVADAIRGEIRFATNEIGDFVVLRRDGRPTYNFAVVVDDIAMSITHVIRGSGHLSNTPRQILMYRAFGSDVPVFAHVPTVLGPDRQKLSKRHGARAIADYRREGYHPDALVNYLSLLSWSSPTGDEVLGRTQLVEEITLDRIGVSDVMFDPEKLRWLSARHIDSMPLEALVEAVRPFLRTWGARIKPELLPDAVAAVRSHLVTFGDIDEQLATLFPPARDGGPLLDAAAGPVVAAAIETLSAVPQWNRESLDAAVRDAGKVAGAKGAALYVPLRQALTSRDHGPPFGAVLVVQGREAVIGRLRSILEAM